MSNNSGAAIPLDGIWRVTAWSKRKEGMTEEEFSRRFAQHGRLAGPLVVKHNGISYVQHHLTDTFVTKLKEELGPQHALKFSIADVDGIVTITFPSAKDLAAFIVDTDQNEELNADTAECVDLTSIQISVGDELVVVKDGTFLL
ncbi:hypothetical protein CCMA1212_001309 [Trichoderma ghanense]|uniref:EthD domain-containing protein n=1 Tax=Trichoderma ghanense TaxID=65468 RepID=A0ABY2HH40_9HYPO